MATISVIVPTLNEAASVRSCLLSLQPIRQAGGEVVLVDAGSSDSTLDLAEPLVDLVLDSPPGRARQMNAGARKAGGDFFWFIHADTRVSAAAVTALQGLGDEFLWGRFDIRLSGQGWALRLVERMMNLRSRLTSVATGDQGMFIRKEVFESIGGWADIPLMEDIALSKTLRALGNPRCFSEQIITSSRRWESQGCLKTIILMWSLRLAYFLGVNPARLARRYYG